MATHDDDIANSIDVAANREGPLCNNGNELSSSGEEASDDDDLQSLGGDDTVCPISFTTSFYGEEELFGPRIAGITSSNPMFAGPNQSSIATSTPIEGTGRGKRAASPPNGEPIVKKKRVTFSSQHNDIFADTKRKMYAPVCAEPSETQENPTNLMPVGGDGQHIEIFNDNEGQDKGDNKNDDNEPILPAATEMTPTARRRMATDPNLTPVASMPFSGAPSTPLSRKQEIRTADIFGQSIIAAATSLARVPGAGDLSAAVADLQRGFKGRLEKGDVMRCIKKLVKEPLIAGMWLSLDVEIKEMYVEEWIGHSEAGGFEQRLD